MESEHSPLVLGDLLARQAESGATDVLRPFAGSWATLLTTFKRDGTAVATPVNLAIEGDHGYFRSYSKAWKTKRMANFPNVELTPCTVRGKPTGEAIHATARRLEGAEELHAREVLARRYPVFQRFVIPFGHKISRYTTLHYEVSTIRSAQ